MRGAWCVAGTPALKPHAVSSAGRASYQYDCNGNATKRIVSSGTYTLTYDAENRMTGVSGAASATFVYDGDGNRVKATIGGLPDALAPRYPAIG